MFNKNPDAIDINVSLAIESQNRIPFYVIDTGDSDLNRIVARKELPSANIVKTMVEGFDKIYYFKSEEDLLAGVNQIKNTDSLQGIDVASVEPYALMFGKVFVHDGYDYIQIASPIYRIYPNNKNEYLPLLDIKQYIDQTWTDTVKDALFDSIPKNEHNYTGTKRRKADELQMTLFKFAIAFGFALILFLSVVAYAKTSSGTSGTSGLNSSVASLVSSKGEAPTTDNFSTLQYNQTKEMLKKMNVDLDNPSDPKELGCYTQ